MYTYKHKNNTCYVAYYYLKTKYECNSCTERPSVQTFKHAILYKDNKGKVTHMHKTNKNKPTAWLGVVGPKNEMTIN